MRTTTLVAIVCLSLSAGCNIQFVEGDDAGVNNENDEARRAALDAFVYGLGQMPVAAEQPKTEIPCLSDCLADGQEGHSHCTYRSYTETRQYDEVVAFQPNSATLWPGSVVRGKDAQEGLLTPVSIELAPTTFSVSLENITNSPVGRMDSPSLSTFREERNRILAGGVTGATPANVAFDITQVSSATQVSLELGGSVDWVGGSVAAGFDFNSSERRTKVLVNFTQAYYTIDVDTKMRPSDFFGSNVTDAQLSAFANAESPPLYVQSITYGRRVVFSLETNDSFEEIRTALSASYEAIVVGAEVDLSTYYSNMLSEAHMEAFVVGGNGAEAVGIIDGVAGLRQYILEGGNYSKDSPGAPIAYKLAYLDNSVTKMAFASDYTERVCVRNEATVIAQLMTATGSGDYSSSEIYGDVVVYLPNETTDGGCDSPPSTPLVLLDNYWYGGPSEEQYAHAVPAGTGKKICIFAEFWDDDWPDSDDWLGESAQEVLWEDGWCGTHTLKLASSEGWADVTVRIDIQ